MGSKPEVAEYLADITKVEDSDVEEEGYYKVEVTLRHHDGRIFLVDGLAVEALEEADGQ